MESNKKTERIHRGMGLLYGLTSTIFVLFAFILPEELKAMIFGAVLFIGLSVLHYVTARGAKNAKNWARRISQIIAIPMLFGFPIGTIIGGALIVNSSSAWTTEQF